MDQLNENSPLALVQEIAEDLAAFSLEFPRFEKAEKARLTYDFAAIRGSVDMTQANLSESKGVEIGGVIAKAENIQEMNIHSGVSAFTEEQKRQARQTSVKAFFDDLMKCCEEKPVVIMLDAYDKCDSALKEWIVDTLLGHHYFDLDKRPAHLLLVIAGRGLPSFEWNWSVDDCDAIVKSVKSLSKWRTEHVKECLQVHGFSYTPEHLETFVKMVEIGLPPSQVVQAMKTSCAVGG